jgi:cation diffusion facilitator family transporter
MAQTEIKPDAHGEHDHDHGDHADHAHDHPRGHEDTHYHGDARAHDPGAAPVTGRAHDHEHDDAHGHDHGNDHGHNHDVEHEHDHGSGPLAWLSQLFGGHSHGVPTTDETLEGSEEGIRAVKISLVGLFITAALQAFVVVTSGSVALLADTIHNLADALTAVPLWIAFVIGRRPPTRRYTYGFGRAEDVAGLAIVAMIALSAAVAGWESVRKLFAPEPMQHISWVIAASIIGFIGNEAVAIYRIRVGKRIGSAALVADGQHAQVDGLTSLAVLLGALGVLAGFPMADPIVGLLITVAIVFVLKSAVREIWWRLMDAVDPTLVDTLESAAKGAPGVQAVDHVKVRWIGHTLHAEANVQVDGSLSTAEGHAVAEGVRHAMLHAAPWLRSAQVHVDPCQHDGKDYHAVTSHHFPDRTSPS